MTSQTKAEKICEIKKTVTKIYESLSELDDEKTETLCQEKCEAIKVFKNVEAELADIFQAEEDDEVLHMLALVHFNRAILHADTAEPQIAEEEFMKCIELLKGRELNYNCILLSLAARNQLGIILQQCNEMSKAQMFLQEAEQIYKDYQLAPGSYMEPMYMGEIFGLSAKDISMKEMLDKLHTETLVCKRQTSSDLSDLQAVTLYSHMALNKQFHSEEKTVHSSLVDKLTDAARTLLTQSDITQSRYYIAAASYQLKLEEEALRKKYASANENEESIACWKIYQRKSATVTSAWIAYALVLLNVSLNRKKETEEKEAKETEENETKKTEEKETKEAEATVTEYISNNSLNLKFDEFDKEIQSIAEQITDKYIVTFDDACTIFKHIHKWVEQLKEYYTLEKSAFDHMLVIYNLSQAYDSLENFTTDNNTVAKLFKKHIDINEYILSELNPKQYSSFCNTVRFEVAQTYMDLLDLKRSAFQSLADASPDRIKKINRLANAVLKHSQILLNSINTHKFGEVTKLTGKIEYPVLMSYYLIGHAYSRMVPPTVGLELQYLQKGNDAYRFVVDYINKYTVEPETAEQESYHIMSKAVVELLLLRETHLKLKLIKLHK